MDWTRRPHHTTVCLAARGPAGKRRLPGAGLLARAVLASFLLTGVVRGQNFNELEFPPAAATNGRLVFGFEGSTQDWKGLDGGNGLSVETKPISIKEGKGALRYEYPVAKGVLSVLCRGGLSVPGARSVSFWIKTSRPTMFGMAVIEKDGSNYFTLFGTRANAWQRVIYDLDELQLADDSTDENKALDVDQISVLGLVDARIFSAGKGEAGDQARTVWVDEVTLSPESTHAAVTGGRALIDGFEELSGRWAAIRITGKDQVEMGTDAVLKITSEAADVKVGKGALEYQYRPDPKSATALFGSTTLRLKAPKSVSAWVKTSGPTLLAWVLSERDGSRYMASVPSPGGEWRHAQLSLAEFSLDKESNDENGRLDGEQVNSMGFVDAAVMLGGIGAEEKTPRTLWVDELAASEQDPPDAHAAREVPGGKEVPVDDFEQEASEWLSFTLVGLQEGKPTLARDKGTKIRIVSEGAPQGKGALQLAYFAPEGGLVAAMRSFRALPITGATCLKLWLKSKYDAKILLQLEEQDGSGYNHQMDLAGGGKWQRHELPLDQFALANDKVDENGRLDLDQVRKLLMVDLSGAAGEPGENTLEVDDVVFFLPAG